MAAGCGGSADSAGADSTPARTDTAGTSAGALRDTTTATREIYIDSVMPGNPLIVHGRARTFENTVQVRARDASGALITEVFTTSVGEMGQHNPLRASVWLTRDPGARVTVEAFEYSAKDGSVRSLTSKAVDIPPARMPVTLVFTTSDCTTTKAFERSVPRTVSVARLVMEALVAGPTDAEKAAGASVVFPQGSRVNSVVMRDHSVTVDFNERLQNVGGSCAAQAINESVMQSLARLPGVGLGVITAGGSRDKALQP